MSRRTQKRLETNITWTHELHYFPPTSSNLTQHHPTSPYLCQAHTASLNLAQTPFISSKITQPHWTSVTLSKSNPGLSNIVKSVTKPIIIFCTFSSILNFFVNWTDPSAEGNFIFHILCLVFLQIKFSNVKNCKIITVLWP